MKQSKLISEVKKLSLKSGISFANLNDNNTVIVCGAGISIESSLPSGGDIVRKFLDTFNLGDNAEIDLAEKFRIYNRSVISKLHDYHVELYDFPRLEVLFQSMKEILSKEDYHLAIQGFLYYNYRKNEFNQKVFSNYQHLAIAEFISHGGKVLTANFDNLIEHAIVELNPNIEYNKVSFPLSESSNLDPENGVLIKYHGDIKDIDTIGIDISNLKINGFNQLETELLDKLFNNITNVIFIGFSISDTLDLVPYLKKRNPNINYIYFKRTAEMPSSIENFTIPLKGQKIETYRYYFTKMSNCYILNSNNNEIQKKSNPYRSEQTETPAFQLEKNDITNLSNLLALLSNKFSISHLSVKYNILKTYGLMNLHNHAEINLLPNHLKDKFVNYIQNVNGNYKYNLNKILKNKQQLDFEYLRFGAMQEYVFLQRGYKLDRIYNLLILSILFLKLKIKLKKTGISLHEELKLNRNICLYILRIFQFLSKKKLIVFVPKYVIKNYTELIKRQIRIAYDLNNLQIYRFAIKEQLYVNGIFRSRFNLPLDKLIEDLIDLYELNVDSNFFIDANNLLRFGAEYIDSERFTEISILSMQLTHDYLNLSKMKKMSS